MNLGTELPQEYVHWDIVPTVLVNSLANGAGGSIRKAPKLLVRRLAQHLKLQPMKKDATAITAIRVTR